MLSKGKLTSWNDDKGFGFITPTEGNKQIFIHITEFINRSNTPTVGQTITYTLSKDKHGHPCANNASRPQDRLRKKKKRKTNKTAIALPVFYIFIVFISLTVITGKLPFEIMIIYSVLSLITFGAYAFDKSAAQSGQWRTKEETLHIFALLGGWPGALLAQNKLRHKSSKESFRFIFWLTVIINIGVLGWLLSPYGAEYVQLIPRINYG